MEEAFYFVIEETELFYNFMSKSDQGKVTYFQNPDSSFHNPLRNTIIIKGRDTI